MTGERPLTEQELADRAINEPIKNMVCRRIGHDFGRKGAVRRRCIRCGQFNFWLVGSAP